MDFYNKADELYDSCNKLQNLMTRLNIRGSGQLEVIKYLTKIREIANELEEYARATID